MLGRVTEKLARPRVREVSTRLRDALMGCTRVEKKQIEPSKNTRFRCSELADMCPRMHTLAAANKLEVVEKLAMETVWTFGIGTAYHDMFQNSLLPLLPNGVFQGWWVDPTLPTTITTGDALHGHPLDYKWIPQPDPSFSYFEIQMFDPALCLSGHCDGVLVWAEDDVEVLELKSAGAWKKDSLDPSLGGNPEPKYVIQAHGYMMLTGLKKTRIVYVLKHEGKMKESILEHVVHLDENVVADITGMLKMTKLAIDEDRILERLPECVKKGDKRAKKCLMRDVCFKDAA